MKTLFVMLIFAFTMASCMSSNVNYTYDSKGRASSGSVRKWKPVKDKTSYQKSMRYAERD